ncbi:MAG TPA: prefoldin subunit alpha [Methanocorpusculum sp.]|nr:prefoldin subunit alpha [Methanocorpusculum sp.]
MDNKTATSQTSQLDQEVHALRAYASEYSQQMDFLSQQMRFLESSKYEILMSIDALNSLEDSNQPDNIQTLLNLGGGVSVRATVTDTTKMLVSIGAGVTVEKPIKDAISFLKDRITEIDASIKRISDSMIKLQNQMAAIEHRMHEIYLKN